MIMIITTVTNRHGLVNLKKNDKSINKEINEKSYVIIIPLGEMLTPFSPFTMPYGTSEIGCTERRTLQKFEADCASRIS